VNDCLGNRLVERDLDTTTAFPGGLALFYGANGRQTLVCLIHPWSTLTVCETACYTRGIFSAIPTQAASQLKPQTRTSDVV